MTDTYGPFDGNPWTETQWYAHHMPAALASGVIGTGAASVGVGALSFTSSGLAITIGTGVASVGGAGFNRSGTPGSTSVTANGNATLSRRDRIVLRRDLGTHSVYPAIIQGTPSATPTSPAIQRTSTQWDLKLFSFLVPPNNGTALSGVIDERAWLDDGTSTGPIVGQQFVLDAYGSDGSVTGTTENTIHSITVTIPSNVEADRLIKVTGRVGLFTPSGVGAGLTIQGGTERAFNSSVGGDFTATRLVTDLTPGSRTFNLQARTTVSGQTVTCRAPYLSVEIV